MTNLNLFRRMITKLFPPTVSVNLEGDPTDLCWPEDNDTLKKDVFVTSLLAKNDTAKVYYFIPYPSPHPPVTKTFDEAYGKSDLIEGLRYKLDVWCVPLSNIHKACDSFFNQRFGEIYVITSIDELELSRLPQIIQDRHQSKQVKFFYFDDNMWVEP